tara:strand:- start:159571 stop:159777 length:207 start_codon:yes stop_codon:yes gene_type:complete
MDTNEVIAKLSTALLEAQEAGATAMKGWSKSLDTMKVMAGQLEAVGVALKYDGHPGNYPAVIQKRLYI